MRFVLAKRCRAMIAAAETAKSALGRGRRRGEPAEAPSSLRAMETNGADLYKARRHRPQFWLHCCRDRHGRLPRRLRPQ